MKYSKPPKKKMRKRHPHQGKRALWIIIVLCALFGILVFAKAVSWEAYRARLTQWFAARHQQPPAVQQVAHQKKPVTHTKAKPVAEDESLRFEFYSTLPGGQDHTLPPKKNVAIIQPEDIEAELLKEKGSDV